MMTLEEAITMAREWARIPEPGGEISACVVQTSGGIKGYTVFWRSSVERFVAQNLLTWTRVIEEMPVQRESGGMLTPEEFEARFPGEAIPLSEAEAKERGLPWQPYGYCTEEARVLLTRASQFGLRFEVCQSPAVAGPGISELEKLAQWAANVQPVPSARLLTGRPSPDREAAKARAVAALERSVDARFAAVAELLERHAREVDDQGRNLSGVNAELTAQIERLAARVKTLEEA